MEALADSLYIAVDLGAGSGRVFLAGVASNELQLEEVRRFHYPPRESDGHLRWDLNKILGEVKTGLREAGERADELQRPVRSLGVDSWGVDYGLIDAQGRLLEDPICYRDKRTERRMELVFEQMPRQEIFAHTGIQFLPFNTLFQLHAHTQAGISDRARRFLLIPDLINFFLTGRAVTEYTNATTTQMLDAGTDTWDSNMLARLGLPTTLLAEIVPTGTDLGAVKPEISRELGLEEVRVVAPATHDTGSAVAGAPLQDGWVYISSGTWSLVGVERDSVLINTDVARHNFTNEGGAFGTIRLLKNVMGLWILESCRKEWAQSGEDISYDRLLDQVEAIGSCPALIFPDDPRLFNPPKMLEAISEQLGENEQPVPTAPAVLAKVILDSLALRYASVVRTIGELTKQKIRGVQIIGGGSQNYYLNQATASATSLPVLAGPVEATVIGNVMAQAIAAGRFESLERARQHVTQNVSLREFAPRHSLVWLEASQRYSAIESRYLDPRPGVNRQ